jgi:hypothetical protein
MSCKEAHTDADTLRDMADWFEGQEMQAEAERCLDMADRWQEREMLVAQLLEDKYGVGMLP